ncbi:response regulator transcription factor [Porphyrobacter sp. CACIAM 03H1]|uniref:response regulator transcription factor n=1 Tax=Porphyrobacter sp. CACIAM 03H1 TaxID=2003315 RepID=UPI0012FE249E|nr:response regulator [Porphyrobacter sp. CACIAM 03H1]
MARILLAEADDCASRIISVYVERRGHQVVCARDGEVAVREISRFRPDLVLSELILPMRSGFDILAAVQHLGLASSTPVIFVTAVASEQMIDRALGQGAIDYIVKPFNLRDLALSADLALAQRRAINAPDKTRGAHGLRGGQLAEVA